MNPSANGWIRKHLPYFLEFLDEHPYDEGSMYAQLRTQGFIYGASVTTLFDEASEQLKWTEEEKTKINLFDALAFTYFDTIEDGTQKDCIETIVRFYDLIDKKQSGFHIQIGKESPYDQLEKIIQRRIQTNEPLLKKNFSHIITNALLFVDILAFDHYILSDGDPFTYGKALEGTLINTIWIGLRQKELKEKYDELLIKLFESSIHYNTDIINEAKTIQALDIDQFDHELSRKYILDLAALAVWGDEQLDKEEFIYLNDLGKHLSLTASDIQMATDYVHEFITSHRSEIAYLNYSNPVKHFYLQTSKTVSTLILRNKNRLIQEIGQSKDLVVLLGQSTIRDLDDAEKLVVKNQLIDICKSIPSLAIFLLPGGGILLPLLTKFIPQLLPSAFNENRLDKNGK